VTPTVTYVQSSPGLSQGAIAGIIIGSLFGGGGLVAIGFLLYRHQPRTSMGEAAVLAQPIEAKPTNVNDVPSGRLQYPQT
jgi:hypothetical protein